MGAVEKVFRRLLLRLPFNPNVRGRRWMNITDCIMFGVRRTNVSQIRTVFSVLAEEER